MLSLGGVGATTWKDAWPTEERTRLTPELLRSGVAFELNLPQELVATELGQKRTPQRSRYAQRQRGETGHQTYEVVPQGQLLGHHDVEVLAHPYTQHRRRVDCLLYTSPSPRDQRGSRMPSSA